jgi:hypothetical protein
MVSKEFAQEEEQTEGEARGFGKKKRNLPSDLSVSDS